MSSLARSYQKYVDDYAKKKDARDYFNVINQPLLLATMEEMLNCDLPLIDLFSPAEAVSSQGREERRTSQDGERCDAVPTRKSNCPCAIV